MDLSGCDPHHESRKVCAGYLYMTVLLFLKYHNNYENMAQTLAWPHCILVGLFIAFANTRRLLCLWLPAREDEPVWSWMSKHSRLTMPQKFVESVTDWHNDWLADNASWQWLIECKIICSHYFWNWIQIGSIGGFPWRPEPAVAGVCGCGGLLWSIHVSCAGLKRLLVIVVR